MKSVRTFKHLLSEVGASIFLPWAVALGLQRLGAPTLLAGLATCAPPAAWLRSPVLVLLAPSFVTGLVGLAFLGSLLARRPLIFFLARDAMTSGTEQAAAFEDKWQFAPFRHLMRGQTLLWAAFLLAEATVRITLALRWPNPTLIAASHIVTIVGPILLVRVCIGMGQRMGRRYAV